MALHHFHVHVHTKHVRWRVLVKRNASNSIRSLSSKFEIRKGQLQMAFLGRFQVSSVEVKEINFLFQQIL